jgi:hypothetical protein
MSGVVDTSGELSTGGIFVAGIKIAYGQRAAGINNNGDENFRKRNDTNGFAVLADREKMKHEKT